MARLLIINADDLGYDPAVSAGILQAMEKGIVTSATLMVNGPYGEAAAKAAKGRPLGLHLNLARWPPCSKGFPPAWLGAAGLKESNASQLSAEVVEAETLAQLERFFSWVGAVPTHLDVHKHLHRHSAVLEGVCAAARMHRLPVRSLDVPMREQIRTLGVRTCDGFIGEAGAEAFWTMDRLREQLEAALKEGVTELMCHPGFAPTRVRSGYGAQREIELETFLRREARALVARLGFTLADWRAV